MEMLIPAAIALYVVDIAVTYLAGRFVWRRVKDWRYRRAVRARVRA